MSAVVILSMGPPVAERSGSTPECSCCVYRGDGAGWVFDLDDELVKAAVAQRDDNGSCTASYVPEAEAALLAEGPSCNESRDAEAEESESF